MFNKTGKLWDKDDEKKSGERVSKCRMARRSTGGAIDLSLLNRLVTPDD